MILARLERVIKDQRGFTLIELLVALAITGLLASGLGMTIFQILSGNAQSSNQMTVVRQVQNAGYWISQDTLMAQSVDTDDPSTTETEILILSWTGWDYDMGGGKKGTDDVEVRYYYDAANSEIWRNEAVTTTIYDSQGQFVDTTNSSSIIRVAQFINSEPTVTLASSKIKVTITATVEGYRPASETRTYEIIPRPIS